MHPALHAHTQPDKAAYIIAETGATLNYSELDIVSNQGAQLLRSLGLMPGDHIAVMLENDLAFVKIAWAANRAGLYFTPVSTSLKKNEIEYIVDNCEAKVFVTSKAIADGDVVAQLNLGNTAKFVTGGQVANYSNWDDAIRDHAQTPLEDECEGSNMVYSSGTTGRPKGIKIPFIHGPLGEGNGAAGVPGLVQFFLEADKNSIFLSPAPLYHAAPLYWSQGYVRIGATVVIMKKFDPESALRALEKYQVTQSQWVPTMFVKMLKLDEAIRNRYDVSSLQVAVHAAAPCPISVKDTMMSWWGDIVHEYYSASESIGMTFINPQKWLSHKGSVGKPIFGELHIVDEETGEEVPAGEQGVIYFSGGNDFEYHGDKDRTLETRNDKGWSTVGDVGYVDSEGYLYLTDRKTHMIISGGVNIYPQEAENIITMHGSVADVAVIGVPNEEFGEEVKAIVQLDDPAMASDELAQDIIDYCRSKLSAIKSPRSVDFVEELPRTATGKLLKRLLKDKYWEGHAKYI